MNVLHVILPLRPLILFHADLEALRRKEWGEGRAKDVGQGRGTIQLSTQDAQREHCVIACLYLRGKCDLGSALGEAQISFVERHELFWATDEMRKL